MNLETILKSNLIGKTIRICTYNQNLYDTHGSIIKKSKNVTNKQFNNGIGTMLHKKNILLGRHRKFENLKIKDLKFIYDDDLYSMVYVILENGQEHEFTLYDELNIID